MSDIKPTAAALSDEARVKALSPTLLVAKRFLRNRLAITGLIILVAMFSFAFLGGVLMPYRQAQVFKKIGVMYKDYAGASRSTQIRMTTAPGANFPASAYSRMLLAKNKGESAFSDGNTQYTLTTHANGVTVSGMSVAFSVTTRKSLFSYAPDVNTGVKSAFEAAYKAGEAAFEIDGIIYAISGSGGDLSVGTLYDIAVGSTGVCEPLDAKYAALVDSYAFKRALADGDTFTLHNEQYSVKDGIIYLGGSPIAQLSNIAINILIGDSAPAFNAALRDAIGHNQTTLEHDGTHYQISLLNGVYTVKSEQETELIDMYAYPSRAHWLGTDANGMDVMTRLMYGGRISLMVGFVVVLFEMVIGITLGGISGYFGGRIDTLIMRFVDLFNCIPYWPMMIIAGSIMDSFAMRDAYMRIFILMIIMGLMGWTGIARVVRGQILSLREQDFMVAAEATGIRASRRIFKHLVPNVMPLLIVSATMSLGSIIIIEATLSYLGLGVKYPLASWGSIINAATNIHVMTNYWFAWIPAGLLILITVLGFNFVGDGLRDAFDPKMKR